MNAAGVQTTPGKTLQIRARCALAGAALAAVCCSSVAVGDHLVLAYIGPDSTHISYALQLAAPAVRVGLYGGIGGTPLSELVGAPVGGAMVFSGEYRHAGLAPQPNDYWYQLRLYTSATVYVLLQSTAATLTNRAIGTMLYNETLAGSAYGYSNTHLDVVVPAGKQLTLSSGLFTGDSEACIVYGTLVRNSSVRSHDMVFTLHAPHTLAEQYDARFLFDDGSAGSTIDGGSNLIVWSHSHVTLSNLRDVQLVTDEVESRVAHVANSVVTMSVGVAPSAEVHLVDCTVPRGDISVQGAFQAARTRFHGAFSTHSALPVLLDGCAIAGMVFVGAGAPVFQNNEFGATVLINPGTSPAFLQNVFAETVYAAALAPPYPTFTGNSFVGRNALLHTGATLPVPPMPIGANYYGEAGGPTYDTSVFLGTRGAIIAPSNAFQVAVPNRTGAYTTDTNIFPATFLCGWIAGQTTLAHQPQNRVTGPLVQGRPTLLCLDMATTVKELKGAVMYALWNGARVEMYQPALKFPPPFTLRRDTSGMSNNQRMTGFNTVNFILPPVAGTTATVSVYLDTTGVTGYGTTGTLACVLPPTALEFAPAPVRPLRLLVIPVQLGGLLTARYPGEAPESGSFAADMRDLLAAQLPIATTNIYVYTLPQPQKYTGWWTLGIEGVLNMGWMITPMACAMDEVKRQYDAAGGQFATGKFDFAVALVRRGTFGAYEGANSKYSAAVLMSTDDKPLAVAHEMGHGIGLYRKEQYDQYPPDGLPATGQTHFITEPGVARTVTRHLESFPASAEFCHWPLPSVARLGGNDPNGYNTSFLDIMGKGTFVKKEGTGEKLRELSAMYWTIPSTLTGFHHWMRGRLSTPLTARSAPALHAAGATRRVLFTGAAMPRAGFSNQFHLVPGSVRAFDASAYLVKHIAPEEIGANSYYHELRLLDAHDNYLGAVDFRVPAVSAGYPYGTWQQTFDIGTNVARYVILNAYDANRVTFYDHRAGAAIQPGITAPLAGAVLSNITTIAWHGPARHGVYAAELSQPLQYLLHVSTDNGATWTPCTTPREGESFAFHTAAFSPTHTLAIRVQSSDGFATAAAVVSNLHVINRRPVVQIITPRAGDYGTTSTLWTLQATAFDTEDGYLEHGVWQSSLQGVLGTGTVVAGLPLDAGNHVLTHIARDAQHAAATAQVAVTVGAMPTINLAFTSNSFVIEPSQLPLEVTTLTLQTGMPHTVRLGVRNSGVPASFTLALYLQPPGAPEALLCTSFQSNVDAFAVAGLECSLTPLGKGLYTFRGVITNCEPPDASPADNEMRWTFTSVLPPRAAPGEVLVDFGWVQNPAGAARVLAITNAGEQTLLLGTLALTGAADGVFALLHDTCSGAAISPGDARTVTIAFAPPDTAFHAANLLFAANDPDVPTNSIAIAGLGVPEPAGTLALAALAFLTSNNVGKIRR